MQSRDTNAGITAAIGPEKIIWDWDWEHLLWWSIRGFRIHRI